MDKFSIAILDITAQPMSYPNLCALLVSTTRNPEENRALLALLAHTAVIARFGEKLLLHNLAQEASTVPVELNRLINSHVPKEDMLRQMIPDYQNPPNADFALLASIAIELAHHNTTLLAKTVTFVEKAQHLS